MKRDARIDAATLRHAAWILRNRHYKHARLWRTVTWFIDVAADRIDGV